MPLPHSASQKCWGLSNQVTKSTKAYKDWRCGKEARVIKNRGVPKNCSINFNFKDWIYWRKTKKPSTQRMGFYISRHLPNNNVYRLQIIFIEDIFVQILHVFRSGTYVNPFFILTGEWDRTAFFWMQLPGRETDTKRANYLFIVHNQLFKEPIQRWVSH